MPDLLEHPRSRTRRDFLVGGATVMALGTVGCGSDSSDGSQAQRSVKTDQGDIRVPAKAKRVACTSSVIAGYLYALDAPVVLTDTLVPPGIKPSGAGFPPLWSDDAERAGTKKLPFARELNLEAIAASKPDLIIGGGQGLPGVLSEKAYGPLSEIAPTVLVSRKLTDWREELDVVAAALGAQERAAGLMRAYNQRLAAVKKRIELPRNPVAVIYQSINRPFVQYPNATLLAQLKALGFTADDVVKRAGNPKPYTPGGDVFEVSPEVIAEVAVAPTLFVLDFGNGTADDLAKQEVFTRLPAFRSGNVYDLPYSSYRPDYLGAMNTLDVLSDLFS